MNSDDNIYEDCKITKYYDIIYKIQEYCKSENPLLLINNSSYIELLNAFKFDIVINSEINEIDDIESISDNEDEN